MVGKCIEEIRDMIVVESGLNYETNEIVLEESKQENVYFSAGLHPTEVVKLSELEIEKTIKQIKNLCENSKCIGVGEIGLDYYWHKDKKEIDKQKHYFRKLLELAESIKKPVIIHSRDAELDCLEIMESYNIKAVMHSFMPKKDWKIALNKALDLGYYISIPAIIVKNKRLKKIARDTPLEKMFTETDSPFLDPEGNRNNRPYKVKYAIEEIAKIKGLDFEEVESQIDKNFNELLNLN